MVIEKDFKDGGHSANVNFEYQIGFRHTNPIDEIKMKNLQSFQPLDVRFHSRLFLKYFVQ